MTRIITDREADRFILFALVCWLLSCIYGPLGVIAQTFLIMRLVWLCDVKAIPALIICHFTGGMVRLIAKKAVLLKLGIIISPGTVCLFVMFAFVVLSLLRNKYDFRTRGFIFVWLPTIVPALLMSLMAYSNNMRSLWTWPVFDMLVPAGYLWAVLAGKSWEEGKAYFLKRMLVLFSILAIGRALRILVLWNFALTPAVICLFIISAKRRLGLGYTFLAAIGALAGLFSLVLGNYFAVEAETGYAGSAELGSTFTQVGVCAFAVCLAWAINQKILRKGAIRILPYIMIAITTFVLFYAVSIHRKYGLVEQQYITIRERWNAKLFNDRGTVWAMGLEEIMTPPYFIKDLRSFIVMDAVIGKDENGNYQRGYGLKLLPHNQVLTLLGRDGWWLGLVLCWFMWWMHIRAVNMATKFGDDPVFMVYFIPVSMGLFHVLGLTGQSTCAAAMNNHAFDCTIVSGLVYGAITERERLMQMFGGRF